MDLVLVLAVIALIVGVTTAHVRINALERHGRDEPRPCRCGHPRALHTAGSGVCGHGYPMAWGCRCEGYMPQEAA